MLWSFGPTKTTLMLKFSDVTPFFLSAADLWRNGGEEPLPLSAHHLGHAGEVPGRGEWNHPTGTPTALSGNPVHGFIYDPDLPPPSLYW